MYRLFTFIYQRRNFFVFLVIEVLCIWLLVSRNSYQQAAFFNSANAISGRIYALRTSISDYFQLEEINKALIEENKLLKEKLSEKTQIRNYLPEENEQLSLIIINQFDFTVAKVINNSVNNTSNYLTLNKGRKDGVMPGMGVVSKDGIVGKVKAVSNYYATVSSVLHVGDYISTTIVGPGVFGSLRWDGKDPRFANLMYIPRHVSVSEGDSLVTSGYNAIFPEGIPVGIIKSISLDKNAAFYEIEVALATDFAQLNYVYVIGNKLKEEQMNLQDSVYRSNE